MIDLVKNLCPSFDRRGTFHRRGGINNSFSFSDWFWFRDVGLPAVMGPMDDSIKVGRGFI